MTYLPQTPEGLDEEAFLMGVIEGIKATYPDKTAAIIEIAERAGELKARRQAMSPEDRMTAEFWAKYKDVDGYTEATARQMARERL